jgi:hypothetical protein
MSMPQRCFVIVPSGLPDVYTKLVAAFANDPRVFVLRDRRMDAGALQAVGIFAVGGGKLDPALRTTVEEKLRELGIRP